MVPKLARFAVCLVSLSAAVSAQQKVWTVDPGESVTAAIFNFIASRKNAAAWTYLSTSTGSMPAAAYTLCLNPK